MKVKINKEDYDKAFALLSVFDNLFNVNNRITFIDKGDYPKLIISLRKDSKEFEETRKLLEELNKKYDNVRLCH